MLEVDDNSWTSARLRRAVAPRSLRAGAGRLVAGPAWRRPLGAGRVAGDPGCAVDARRRRRGSAVAGADPDRGAGPRERGAARPDTGPGATRARGAHVAPATDPGVAGHRRPGDLGCRVLVDTCLCQRAAAVYLGDGDRRGMGAHDRGGGGRPGSCSMFCSGTPADGHSWPRLWSSPSWRACWSAAARLTHRRSSARPSRCCGGGWWQVPARSIEWQTTVAGRVGAIALVVLVPVLAAEQATLSPAGRGDPGTAAAWSALEAAGSPAAVMATGGRADTATTIWRSGPSDHQRSLALHPAGPGCDQPIPGDQCRVRLEWPGADALDARHAGGATAPGREDGTAPLARAPVRAMPCAHVEWADIGGTAAGGQFAGVLPEAMPSRAAAGVSRVGTPTRPPSTRLACRGRASVRWRDSPIANRPTTRAG